MPRLTTLLFFLAACAGESTQPEPEDTGDPTTEEETEAAPPSPGLAIGESDPTDRRSEDVAPAIDMPETEIDWEIPEVPCAHMRAFSHVSNAGTFSEEETTDEAGRLTSWSFEFEAEQYAYISGPPRRRAGRLFPRVQYEATAAENDCPFGAKLPPAVGAQLHTSGASRTRSRSGP